MRRLLAKDLIKIKFFVLDLTVNPSERMKVLVKKTKLFQQRKKVNKNSIKVALSYKLKNSTPSPARLAVSLILFHQKSCRVKALVSGSLFKPRAVYGCTVKKSQFQSWQLKLAYFFLLNK